MQFSLATIALLTGLAAAAPTPVARDIKDDVSDAQNQWRADTSTVSDFLSSAPTMSGPALQSAAAVALAAEQDELTHKKVLDANFLNITNPDPVVVAANDVLVTQGTFQFVIDGLTDLANRGATLDQAAVQNSVDQINGDRCGKVLPAINQYFQVAGNLLQNGAFIQAAAPQQCANV